MDLSNCCLAKYLNVTTQLNNMSGNNNAMQIDHKCDYRLETLPPKCSVCLKSDPNYVKNSVPSHVCDYRLETLPPKCSVCWKSDPNYVRESVPTKNSVPKHVCDYKLECIPPKCPVCMKPDPNYF